MSDRIQRIESALRCAFEPETIEVIDESHKHRGHAGAQAGGGHFRVTLVSSHFEGRSRIERHRMVYDALGSEMESEIHALAITARCPSEAAPATKS